MADLRAPWNAFALVNTETFLLDPRVVNALAQAIATLVLDGYKVVVLPLSEYQATSSHDPMTIYIATTS